MSSRQPPTFPPPGDGGRARLASLALGEVLDGKYRIEERIAEGGMGVVLRATHLDLDCAVAIKLIRPEHIENEDVVARLLMEARIAAGLRSKHVNRVLDVGRSDDGLPYLVLEYMEGSDLSTYLEQRGQLPVSEAVDCVLQACEALAEAHAFGIVHRDLKPDNLFLSEEADGNFVLKVLDFGISKAPASRRRGRTLTNPFEVVGSPTYMAPEQIRGEAVDARADIWALGTLLHELVSGEAPFAAGTVTDTFSMILDERYSLPPIDATEATEPLAAIIRKCTQRRPDDRYQDVVELAAALGPLGTDPLQPRRVAKVAAASRARVISAAEKLPLAATSPGSPLPYRTPVFDSGVTASAFRSPARLRMWLTGSALGVAAGVGIALLAMPAGRSPPVGLAGAPVPDVAAVDVVTSLATDVPSFGSAPVSDVTTAPSGAKASVLAPPSPPDVPKKKAMAPWRPPSQIATAHAKQAASARPSVSAAADVAAEAPLVEATAQVDAEAADVEEAAVSPLDAAWDPKTFGGRR
jgi:serine/threonine protein kinase